MSTNRPDLLHMHSGQQKTEPHPSWQASKSPIISGAIIAGEQGAHTNFEESECD